MVARAQTTQGVIAGTIADSITGLPIPSASIRCVFDETSSRYQTRTDSRGRYAMAGLSPGQYTVTVEMSNYQIQQGRALLLPVAGRIELNFRMRPIYDLWEAGLYRSWVTPESKDTLGFYGPDVDTSRVAVFNASDRSTSLLENARSDVESQQQIQNLPLPGRDTYALLLLLPGVTSDTATARGLGLSVNGQRPSSANYLLDGVENNNQLITGPLTATAPEFVQEYRISTTNYSSEYGRTSGFVANAITRSGTNVWRAEAFSYVKNQDLDANGFHENASGIGRLPLKEWEPGLLAGGPLVRKRLFLFGGFETRRFKGQADPQAYALPTLNFVDAPGTSAFASQLLRTYAPVSQPAGPGVQAIALISPPANFNRMDGTLRMDYLPRSEAQRVFARVAFDQFDEPQFLFNPYQGFSTRYRQKALPVAAGVTSQADARLTHEFRISRTGDSVVFETPRTGLPQLQDLQSISFDGKNYPVLLPGSIVSPDYDYRNRGSSWELIDNWTFTSGRHSAKAGGGYLQRNANLAAAVLPNGELQFDSLQDLGQNTPDSVYAEVDRLSPSSAVAPDRSYRYRQFYGFVQDSFHATRRLTFDLGLRYEYLGAPVNTGAQKDLLIQLGSGSDFPTRLANQTFVLPSGTGDQTVMSVRPSTWAVRSGFAWDLTGRGQTVVRGSYGIFYDPLYDNLWENVIQNRYQSGFWTLGQPVALPATLQTLEGLGVQQNPSDAVNPVVFQPDLRAPRVQSAFVGIEQELAPRVILEVDVLASGGRELITTDIVNRQHSVAGDPANPSGRLNPAIDDEDYRANQGSSEYSAMAASVRFNRRAISGQLSYTWSHSIDNQSEPLAGTFLNFNQLLVSATPQTYTSGFTRQFDSGGDRADSDFDQRHNLVFYVMYALPSPSGTGLAAHLAGHWNLSALGALRSGLPYTVYANPTGAPVATFVNERANLVSPGQALVSTPAPEGQVLLNSAAFSAPQSGTIGSSGRNAFTGPGIVNGDLSISRSFHPRAIPERVIVTIRADAYNFLNHANLNNPNPFFGTPQFGVATYGRTEINNSFPLLQPLTETARQIQLMLRIQF